jgi:hypothetical protein
MRTKKAIDLPKVLSVIEKLAMGRNIKQIAYEEELKPFNVYEIKDRFPLLCWRKKDVQEPP